MRNACSHVSHGWRKVFPKKMSTIPPPTVSPIALQDLSIQDSLPSSVGLIEGQTLRFTESIDGQEYTVFIVDNCVTTFPLTFYELMMDTKKQFTVKTYLCYPTEIINDLDHAEEHKDSHFISVDDAERMREIKPCMKTFYNNGALELFYEDTPLVTVRDWGVMELLIPSFYSMIDDFLLNKEGEGSIPDCSTNFYMNWVGEDKFLFERYDAGKLQYSLILPIYAFLKALLDHFEHFYVRMGECFDGIVPYEVPLKFVRRLKDIVDNRPQSEWWPCIIRGYVHDPAKPIVPFINSDPLALRYACSVEGNGKIVKVSRNLRPESCLGFFYMEYKGVSVFKNYTLYFVIPFCRQVTAAIENVVMHGIAGVAGVEGLRLTLQKIGLNQLQVTMSSGDEYAQFVVPLKQYVSRLRWITYEFFSRVDEDEESKKALVNDFQAIIALRLVIEALPNE